MNLLWRLLLTIFTSKFFSSVNLLDECTTSFHVLPTDIDVLLHMNNGRYFSFMDLARTSFIVRAKIFHLMNKNKLYPVVASEMIRFKKSLKLFQRFQITTRIMGWDDKFFYIAHHFKSNNDVYALSLVKACFLHKKNGRITSDKFLELIGHQHVALDMPDWVTYWQQADQEFHDETMKEGDEI